jgi:hypothetical protein
LAEAPPLPVETPHGRNARQPRSLQHRNQGRETIVDQGKTDKPAPAPVISRDPEAELEKKLKRDPDDLDAKVDVGSDESMDASDPPSSSHPGQKDDPVPSSGFPE